MNLVLLRIGLLLMAAAVTAAILGWSTGTGFELQLAVPLASLYFIPVNLLCLWLVRRSVDAQGSSLRELAGFDRGLLGRDLLLGVLWQLVLFIPFALGLTATLLIFYGPAGLFGGYETAFAPEAEALAVLPGWFMFASAVTVALLFPITNAPTEEFVYRGHAQRRLLRKGSGTTAALLIPSMAFGVQHALLAPVPAGMIAYTVAFTLWGLGAALAYHYGGRLMPLIVAHFITNAITAAIPLGFLLRGA